MMSEQIFVTLSIVGSLGVLLFGHGDCIGGLAFKSSSFQAALMNDRKGVLGFGCCILGPLEG